MQYIYLPKSDKTPSTAIDERHAAYSEESSVSFR